MPLVQPIVVAAAEPRMERRATILLDVFIVPLGGAGRGAGEDTQDPAGEESRRERGESRVESKV
jgi:hypothetical protein